MYIVYDERHKKFVKGNGWRKKYTDSPTDAKVFKTVAGIKRAFGNYIVRDENGNYMKNEKGNYITYFPENRFKIVPLEIKVSNPLN